MLRHLVSIERVPHRHRRQTRLRDVARSSCHPRLLTACTKLQAFQSNPDTLLQGELVYPRCSAASAIAPLAGACQTQPPFPHFLHYLLVWSATHIFLFDVGLPSASCLPCTSSALRLAFPAQEAPCDLPSLHKQPPCDLPIDISFTPCRQLQFPLVPLVDRRVPLHSLLGTPTASACPVPVRHRHQPVPLLVNKTAALPQPHSQDSRTPSLPHSLTAALPH